MIEKQKYFLFLDFEPFKQFSNTAYQLFVFYVSYGYLDRTKGKVDEGAGR